MSFFSFRCLCCFGSLFYFFSFFFSCYIVIRVYPVQMAAATSPRLPSPPPLTEVQFGPGSDESAGQLRRASKDEHGDDSGVTRRVRSGSKALDMAAGPPLIPLAQVSPMLRLRE